jgi:hypothetical protein
MCTLTSSFIIVSWWLVLFSLLSSLNAKLAAQYIFAADATAFLEQTYPLDPPMKGALRAVQAREEPGSKIPKLQGQQGLYCIICSSSNNTHYRSWKLLMTYGDIMYWAELNASRPDWHAKHIPQACLRH